MGNICSRSANKADTTSPGRVLGTSNQQSQDSSHKTSAPPKTTNWKQSPGRTLGDSSPSGAQGGADEARSNAAIAAQVSPPSTATFISEEESHTVTIANVCAYEQKRAESGSANKGKLGSKLAAQKAKTQTQTLAEVSRDERGARDADQAAEASKWN